MNDIKRLKDQYSFAAKKYNLPAFEQLNRDFEIEKIDHESECILRVVRKAMMEKIVNSLGFLEMLLNPVNVPRMYMSAVKSLKQEDMNATEAVYNALSSLVLSALALEIDYTEQKEAEMISKINSKWSSVKGSFGAIIRKLGSIHAPEAKKERSYFG